MNSVGPEGELKESVSLAITGESGDCNKEVLFQLSIHSNITLG